jgi:hypothetical protein
MAGKEIFVEFVILGNSLKATAIDPESGLEATVIGPANAAQSTMAQAARRKLEFMARKKG